MLVNTISRFKCRRNKLAHGLEPICLNARSSVQDPALAAFLEKCSKCRVHTTIIGDPVVGTINPPDLPTASSLMSQPPYRTQNDHYLECISEKLVVVAVTLRAVVSLAYVGI